MADFKHHMFQRLHSARQWLKRAEESFGKDRDIRAELDLMLAQAELQHAKEASRSRQWRYKYSLLRHGLAFGLALTVIGASIGGASYVWHRQQQSVVPVPIAVQENRRPVPSAEPKTEQAVTQDKPAASTAAAVSSVDPPAAAVSSPPEQAAASRASDNRKSEYQVTRPVEKQVTLSPEEMQQLVRAAGKSLRGQ